MIGGCISSAHLIHSADIYKKVRTSSPSGQITLSWVFDKTIACFASPFISTSFKAQGTSELFGESYESIGYLNLKTKIDLGRSVRVTNIRNTKTGVVIYKEVELKNNPPTWYNSQGSSPVNDPFGGILEYNTLLIRAESQGDQVV